MQLSRGRISRRIEPSVAYFETQAATWEAAYDAPTARGHSLRERRRRLFGLLDGAGGNLLDVGCGPAVLAGDLAARGWRYHGVDAAVEMVRQGRAAGSVLGVATLAVADVVALPFAPGHFDAVLCIGVLDRVPDQGQAIKEMLRVVRPGGVVIVSFPNMMSPFTAWSNYVFRPGVGAIKRFISRLGERPSSPDLNSSAIVHSPDSARKLLEQAGAEVRAVVHFYFNVLLPPLEELFPRLGQRVASRLEHLHKTRWAWLGAGLLVCAVRGSDSSYPGPRAAQPAPGLANELRPG